MPRILRKSLCLLLIAAIVASAAPALAEPNGTSAKGTIDTMVNYDAKLRVGKIIYQDIKEDLAKGRSIDFGRIGKEVTKKPFLAQVGIETGCQVTGKVIQMGLSGLCPPFGLIAGTVASTVLGSVGGAVGYEVGASIESGRSMSKTEMFGRALKGIDMPGFIGRNIGGVIGSVIGQSLIPIPFVGLMVGGIVGSLVGGLAVDQLRKIPALGNFFDKLQSKWESVGDALIRKGQAKASAAAVGGPAPAYAPVVAASLAPASPGTPSGAPSALQAAREECEALHRRYVEWSSRSDLPAGSLETLAARIQAAQARYDALQAAAKQ